jgi:peptidyl-prolyl cis-trans isomerase SurA
LALAATARVARAAPAESLDRVVASVDYRAITESDVEQEFRLEQFLDGKSPAVSPDEETKKTVRDRLIDQLLLMEEAEQTALVPPSKESSAQELEDVRKQLGSEEAFASALQAVGLSNNQVLERLERRQKVLELIQRRLGPEAFVERAEIEAYYNKTFVPSYQKENSGPVPPLREVSRRIREILIQGRINTLLEDWLKDLKASHRVELHTF